MDHSIEIEPIKNSVYIESVKNNISVLLVEVESIYGNVSPTQVIVERKEVG